MVGAARHLLVEWLASSASGRIETPAGHGTPSPPTSGKDQKKVVAARPDLTGPPVRISLQ